MRSEQTVFDELGALCLSKGFIHALAFIAFRDTIVGFAGDLTTDDLGNMRSRSHLIRTEITTLIGLMTRGPIDFSLPTSEVLSHYVEQSETLLDELHQTMLPSTLQEFTDSTILSPDNNPFTSGRFLRESIFYSGESAYTHQYRDFTGSKYGADSEWLLSNRSLDLKVGHAVCLGIVPMLHKKLLTTLHGLRNKPQEEWTVLPGFTISINELASHIDCRVKDVRDFVEAFTLPDSERNIGFTSLHEFNNAYAYPFIRKDDDEFILLQYYGITEAFYETPFYWMLEDSSYSPLALKHRGAFTETFTTESLIQVFGPNRVFQNVDILNDQGRNLGEIDTLVIFGNRLIVVQAKSKKLTLESRKGNDRALRNDFKKAIQDAVDQSFSCAKLLSDTSVTLHTRDQKVVHLPDSIRTIFPLTVVPDHYPALAFQTLQFLEVDTTDRIVFPLVTDIFALDAMTEMLSTPLWFLSYLRLRARYGDRLMASHEHMILSYHLKYNLWISGNIDLMMMEDDCSVHLDTAMAVRRDGVSGDATPDGILTRLVGTPLGRVISEIENQPDTAAIDFGLTLLELRENAIDAINNGIDQVLQLHSKDGNIHNVSISFPDASTGLTIHCSQSSYRRVEDTLRKHCVIAKYRRRIGKWFGLALHPDGSVQCVGESVGEWKFDRGMENVAKRMSGIETKTVGKSGKVGRNDSCPCGSGKKFKKCCLGV